MSTYEIDYHFQEKTNMSERPLRNARDCPKQKNAT